VTTDRYVDIPEAVQEIYRIWRPSPLFRAHNLEKALGTTCRIYYKCAAVLHNVLLNRCTHRVLRRRYEGGSPAGSHKPNTAVPQVMIKEDFTGG
jgi:tryptophan synthase beta chain